MKKTTTQRRVLFSFTPPDPTDEANKWALQSARATAALGFWNSFIGLRMGSANDQPLTQDALSRLLCLLRAVSWVESQHGTGTGVHPAEDPVQCANPGDSWWTELIDPSAQNDRFVGGPGKSNYWAGQLPAAAAADGNFPAAAKLSGLGDETNGHNDAAFNPDMSYYWGVPILIHKINSKASGATFKCGSLDRDDLIAGAVAYNGGGVSDYEDRIRKTLDVIGCLPTLYPLAHPAVALLQEVLGTLGHPDRTDIHGVRRVFPGGVSEIHVKRGDAEIRVVGFQSRLGAAHPLDLTLLPDDWNQTLATLVEAARQATPGSVDGACNAFAGKALEQLYGVTDFESNGRYKLANEIAHFVAVDASWKFLGDAANQTVLRASQDRANQKLPVIAVLEAMPHGHVALVIPGTLQGSGHWNLNVPNSACAFLDDPAKSYYNDKLSFAFEKPDGVKIYCRG
jgi:hypothetical protein